MTLRKEAHCHTEVVQYGSALLLKLHCSIIEFLSNLLRALHMLMPLHYQLMVLRPSPNLVFTFNSPSLSTFHLLLKHGDTTTA